MVSTSSMVSPNPTIATLPKRSCVSLPSSDSPFKSRFLALPMAASVSVLLWTNPVNAGILSGFSGLEAVPGPQLPRIEILEKWNADNQKKYAELDQQFKSSKVLKELLEKSKQNKERLQLGVAHRAQQLIILMVSRRDKTLSEVFDIWTSCSCHLCKFEVYKISMCLVWKIYTTDGWKHLLRRKDHKDLETLLHQKSAINMSSGSILSDVLPVLL